MMKKFATLMVAATFIAGAACGGGSGWSQSDKDQLALGKTLAIGLGTLTEKQSECYSKWIQSRYDSLAKAQEANGDTEAKASLNKKCDITSKEVTTATTTATPSNYEACQAILTNVDEGLNALDDGIVVINDISKENARKFLATAKEFVSAAIESLQPCAEESPASYGALLSNLNVVQKSLNDLDGLF